MKRSKSPVFSEVLEEISGPPPHPEDEMPEPLKETVSASQVQQPNDWLLHLLSGLIPEGDGNASSDRVGMDAATASSSYLEDAEFSLEDAVAPLLEAIANCEQDAIAEELGLHDGMSANELQRIRRAFARNNHPDRFDPAQRDLATHRMTIANMLIDEQLKHKTLLKH